MPKQIKKTINNMTLTGTPFQIKVWRAVSKIPTGTVLTYKDLANKVGYPKAIRAVANAVGANPYPIKIPCHRVVRSDGGLGGYSGPGGVRAKKRLLEMESRVISSSQSHTTSQNGHW